MELSRSAGGFNHPPDRQAEALREIARQQANANTWNMVQTGVMAAQLAAQSAIHDQMEEVKRQNENALAIQQELLNREQLQQYLEEFIFQTEKLVADFSAKSDVPASTRYFLLQSVLVQVEQDGIDTATIRGRDNKSAFERAMASVNRLVAELLKDPEVQDAIKWAEKEEAKRAEKRRRVEADLNRLYQQRASIESQLDPVSFGEALQKMPEWRKSQLPDGLWPVVIGGLILSTVLIAPLLIVVPAILFDAHQYRRMLNAEANEPIHYQLSTLDNRIAALESELP
ncbi:MAG: hypothetical protein R3C18_08470 [Planctomycetaceae bacterium]